MTTDSQDKRYRDGYAAGHRDGSVQPGDTDVADERLSTGDEWADNGYSDGFSDGRDKPGGKFFSGMGRVIKDVFWIPKLSSWLHRRAGTP
jgi:hypothetical protein